MRKGGGVVITQKYIVMFSGGITSWYAAKRLLESGTQPQDVLLLFADTKIEDEDSYRFLHESAANLGCKLEIISHGLDPWESFKQARFLGNSRVDVCSRMLKRDPIKAWLKENASPETHALVYGMTWDEVHRIERLLERWKPWTCMFPNNEAPFLFKDNILRIARSQGLEPPRLYSMGFEHSNCGGFCVKAGQSHFTRLLSVMPDRYAHHEEREREFRAFIGKDVSILRDTKGGDTKPLTLEQHRINIEAGKQPELFEYGGCGCFVGDE